MSFEPPVGLRNRHLQTILSSVGPRRFAVRRAFDQHKLQEKPVILECHDGIRLAGVINQAAAEQSEDLVVLIHGWEGSVDSSYMVSMASKLLDSGIDVFRLNLRDHGDTHHLNEELFNSTLIEEVISGLQNLQRRYRYQRYSLVGFSLGGNFALRVAGLTTTSELKLERVIAFCPVLHAERSNSVLTQRSNFLYERYFVRKWKKSLRKKNRVFPQNDLSPLLPGLKNLDDMNEQLVPRFTQFSTAAEYFQAYAITGDVLAKTNCPCYLHFAKDDMIIPWQDVERLPDNPDLHITITEHGGHCGYLSNWRFDSWQDQRVLELVRR